MIMRDTDLHQIEKQLMPLYFEINVLESMVENANPDVRARCEKTMRSLFDQYETVNNQVQTISKERDSTGEENFIDIAKNVRELLDKFESIAPWVRMQISG